MDIIYIDEQQKLNKALDETKEADQIAVDLEFDKHRYRYGFNMCLMQLFNGKSTYLIDPLSNNLDISHTFEIMEDPGTEKVVFAFGEDLRLFHKMGCFPKNILDLDIASSLLDYPPSSLTNLLKDVLDIEPGGSSQQSNWFRRPLSDKQKEYAASDVYHLLDLRDTLMKQAAQNGLREWIHQENAIHDELDYSDENHNSYLKEKDKKGHSEYSWFIFKRLMDFFDETARSYNKPVYHMIHKKQLAEIAKEPEQADRWQQIKGIYGRLKNDSFQQKLQQLIDESKDEAQARGLSKNDPAQKRMSNEEYRAYREQQNLVGRVKSDVFKPLQNHIEKELGSNVKSYILPNRLVSELITGEADPLPPYKKELFINYAEQLDVDLGPYI